MEIAPPSGENQAEVAELDGEIDGEIDGEVDGEVDGEIAAPLPLLRTAWLRGELPRAGPGSLGPQVEHLCVEGRSYLLDSPTALRQWERGEKRYSLRSLVFALQNSHLPHARTAEWPPW